MRKDFYIFRHGETDYNLEKRWQGCGIDTDLNETGICQAKALVEKLASKNLEIIYSSALKRALKTAEIIADSLNLEVKVIKDLREGSFGESEGLRKEEAALKYPEIFNLWYDEKADHLDVAFPGGETKRQMQQRMLGVLEGLLKTRESVIGIASHGSSIRYLLLGFGKILGRLTNTALFHVVYEDGEWRVEDE